MTDRAARRGRPLTVAVGAAVVTNILIVFTGGVVRVSGSGLGCSDWPTCDGQNITPIAGGDHAAWQAYVEFGNRLLTFVVLAAAIAAVVMVRRTGPWPAPTRRLAWALPLGVLLQAVLGGITVLTGLSPVTVAAHFLVSMALIWAAVGLFVRTRDIPPSTPPVARGIRHGTTAVAVVAGIVLVLGTIVTGSGPHGGDVAAPRFDLDLRVMAIAHADAVWLLIGLTIALVAVTWASPARGVARGLQLLLVVELAQGGIGYLQYWLGVPPTLVSLHILGAAVLWAVVTLVWFRARPPGVTDPMPPDVDERRAPQDTSGKHAPRDASELSER
jgi:heme a synthase